MTNKNVYTSFEEIMDNSVRKKIKDTVITDEIYNNIINKIIEIGNKNLTINDNSTALESVITIANQHVDCIQRPHAHVEGLDQIGLYKHNQVFYDPTFEDSQSIRTILHEFTHHLLCEILEELLKHILNIQKNHILESLVYLILTGTEYFYLANEYAAHTTEEYFIPENYCDYGSVNLILNDENVNYDIALEYIGFGKTMGNDLIKIMSNWVTEDILEKINKQFIKDNIIPPNNTKQPEWDKLQVWKPQAKYDGLKFAILNIYDFYAEVPNEVLTLLNEIDQGFKEHTDKNNTEN